MPQLVVRGVFAGALMGMANLVPGISGGTMLLAAGVYSRFINAIAELTTFTFKRQSLIILGTIVVAAAVAIVGLSGAIKNLVVDHRWIMYSLFIGLTLGGVPVVWKMIRGVTPGVWAGAVAGFIGMAVLAIVQAKGWGVSGGDGASPFLLFVAGVAGASAMILPGVSGAYLLLVLGVYLPILAGLDAFKDAALAFDLDKAWQPFVRIVLPTGMGVVVGVVVVSHALKWVLQRFENATLGVLLGLLVGAVVGLWPFQEVRRPEPGEMIKGQVMTPELIEKLDKKDYPMQVFTPTVGQAIGAVALVGTGFAVTLLVARLGGEDDAAAAQEASRAAAGGE